jgi:surface polysaccharide O-acyltransferase-like enzyme
VPVLKPQNYNSTIDFLRIISIFAVIMIHTTTKTIQVVGGDLHLVPWALFLNQSARFAVPLFFLISGFVLELSSPPDLNYWNYLKKRLSRIFIPYLVWSLIYYFIIYRSNSLSFPLVLLSGGASYQLYFIPTLLVFYLIFPLFHRNYRFFANVWVLIVLGIFQLFFLYHDYYLGSYRIPYPLNIALLNFYVFILGIFASHQQPNLQKIFSKFKYLLLIIAYLLAIYVFYEGGSRYSATGNYLAFYSQWRPSIFFYTLSLFAALYYFLGKIHLPQSLIKTFSSLSFFVFFFHVIVLEIIWNTIGLRLFSQTSGLIVREFWYDPVFFATVAGVSFLIAYLCHRLPFLSKLTG